MTHCKVTAVEKEAIKIQGQPDMAYGTCVWVAGIALRPITEKIIKAVGLEHQPSRRGLIVDKHFRVTGTKVSGNLVSNHPLVVS